MRRLTNKKIPLGMFDNRISEKEQLATYEKLTEKNVRNICKEHLTELANFIDKFEGNIYLK